VEGRSGKNNVAGEGVQHLKDPHLICRKRKQVAGFLKRKIQGQKKSLKRLLAHAAESLGRKREHPTGSGGQVSVEILILIPTEMLRQNERHSAKTDGSNRKCKRAKSHCIYLHAYNRGRRSWAPRKDALRERGASIPFRKTKWSRERRRIRKDRSPLAQPLPEAPAALKNHKDEGNPRIGSGGAHEVKLTARMNLNRHRERGFLKKPRPA